MSLLFAPPAAAHEIDGPVPTGIASDSRSSVVTDDLPPEITFEVLQNGLALRLHNGSGMPVLVREPGLHVPPGMTAQWHLDSAHPSPGPAVQPWRVVVEADGVAHQVLGEVRWTPGPAPWPWLTGAALLAAGLALAAWRLPGPTWLIMPLGLAVLTSIGHTTAALAARTAEGPRWTLLGDYLPQAGCWALSVLAIVLLSRNRHDGLPLAVLAALGLVLVTLNRDSAVLGASTILVTLPADLDRVLVTAILGTAGGALAGLLLGRSTPTAARAHASSA